MRVGYDLIIGGPRVFFVSAENKVSGSVIPHSAGTMRAFFFVNVQGWQAFPNTDNDLKLVGPNDEEKFTGDIMIILPQTNA